MKNFIAFCALALSSNAILAYEKDNLMSSYFSVVMIRGYTPAGGLAYGSGVVVGDNEVITNCHVFRATDKPWISRGEDAYSIVSVKADVWHDLCLVKTHALPFKPVPIGKTTTLTRGQEIVAFGHSNGVPAPLTSTGVVKALHDSEQGKVIRSSAKFLMGASGSGLFDLDGKLVGINTFKTAGIGGSIHYALPIEWLDTLRKQEDTQFPVKGKALWEEEETKKPFYMQAAVPESRQDWPALQHISQKWAQVEPRSSDAWFTLGLAEENLKNSEAAEKAYAQAARLDKTHYEALVKLGEFAKARGDKTELHRIQIALADIDQALAKEFSNMMGCDQTC